MSDERGPFCCSMEQSQEEPQQEWGVGAVLTCAIMTHESGIKGTEASATGAIATKRTVNIMGHLFILNITIL